jgi:hypothetical protein
LLQDHSPIIFGITEGCFFGGRNTNVTTTTKLSTLISEADMDRDETDPATRQNPANKFVLTVLTLLMLATGLSAQSAFSVSYRLVAHIPFSFTADNHTFPAGTYLVEADRVKQVVLLQGENQDVRFMPANPKELSEPTKQSELVFQRYGSQFVFKAVHVQSSWEAQSLPTSEIEKELAKAGRPHQLVMVQSGSRFVSQNRAGTN